MTAGGEWRDRQELRFLDTIYMYPGAYRKMLYRIEPRGHKASKVWVSGKTLWYVTIGGISFKCPRLEVLRV